MALGTDLALTYFRCLHQVSESHPVSFVSVIPHHKVTIAHDQRQFFCQPFQHERCAIMTDEIEEVTSARELKVALYRQVLQ